MGRENCDGSGKKPVTFARERIEQLAGTLSGGEQGMLSMARALMAKPKVNLRWAWPLCG